MTTVSTHQTTDISSVHGDYCFVLSEISPLKLTLAGYPVHSSDTDIPENDDDDDDNDGLVTPHAWLRSY